jgi:predicted dehydrogenase
MGIAKDLVGFAKRVRRGYGLMRFEPMRLDGTVRVAMIGTGKAARYHLEVLEKIRGVRVTCIVNRGGSDPSSLMQRYAIPTCYVGIEKALANRDFDAAVVAVTPSSTLEISKTLLASDIHCLIEKPLGTTVEEASALCGAAVHSNATSAVAFNRRFYSAVLKAAEYVEALGVPYAIHVDSAERLEKIRKSGEPEEATRNRIVTNTCHSIDLFTAFAGEHEAVESAGSPRYVDSIRVDYTGSIRFRKGASGMFSSHWSSPGDRVVTLYGRDYKLEINLSRNRLTATHRKAVRRFRPGRIDWVFKAGVYLQDFQFLAAALAGAPVEPPFATLEQAFQTHRLAFALMETEPRRSDGGV